jgi:hypothetical protein
LALAAVAGPAFVGDPREEAVAACRAAVSQAIGSEDVRLNRVDRRNGAYQVRFRVRNAAGFRVMAQCAYDPAGQQVTSVEAPGAPQAASAQAG